MKTFKDNNNRDWEITINVAAIKRVRDLIGVDLMQAIEGELLKQLATDPVMLCDVIYCLCKPQADDKNISDTHFGQAMSGDAIDNATIALLDELVEFFPSGKRKILKRAISKLRAMEQKALMVADQLIDRQMDAQFQKALAKITDSAMNLPESSQ